jgi:hypothetical protein
MDWYHLDTSQLKCIHSMWELCWIVEQLWSYSPFCECIILVALCNYGAHVMVCLPWVACKRTKDKGIYVSHGRFCVTNPVGHTHMLCYGCTRTGFTGLCSLCGCSIESYFLWLVRHVGALPKDIQGPCLVSRVDAYMGTCPKCHLLDTSLSLLWRCWNHHLVTHNILLNP